MKKALLVAVVLLAAATAGAWQLGYLGQLSGLARLKLAPQDRELLSFFDKNTSAVGIVHVPLLSPMPDSETLSQRGRDFVDELYETSGVRLDRDVDSVAINESLHVARGRFAWSAMEARLTKAGYTITNDEGTPLAIKTNGDALAVWGDYAVHGTAHAVSAALERKRKGDGLAKGDQLVQAFDDVGWWHGAVGAAIVSRERPDIASILAQRAELRSVTVAIDREALATAVEVIVDAGTATQARSLQQEGTKMLDDAAASLKGRADAQDVRAAILGIKISADGNLAAARATIPDAALKSAVDNKNVAPIGAMARVEGALRALR